MYIDDILYVKLCTYMHRVAQQNEFVTSTFWSPGTFWMIKNDKVFNEVFQQCEKNVVEEK